MPIKPNYSLRRADRRRAQQQKHQEKQKRREEKAALSKAARGDGFVLFDVVYDDGTLSSNRKVAAADLDPLDPDRSALRLLEAQDRKIAEASGRDRAPIKSIARSAAG
jgi:hypothetical protein